MTKKILLIIIIGLLLLGTLFLSQKIDLFKNESSQKQGSSESNSSSVSEKDKPQIVSTKPDSLY